MEVSYCRVILLYLLSLVIEIIKILFILSSPVDVRLHYLSAVVKANHRR